MYKSSFDFTLSEVLHYPRDGEIASTNKLTCFAPSAKHGQIVVKIKQAVMRAFARQAEINSAKEKASKNIHKVHKENDAEISGDDMLVLLGSSEVVDMADMLNWFKELLLSGVCCIPPITKEYRHLLKDGEYDNLPYCDIERLMGEYIATFLLPSILMKKS